ncbi:MAG: FtsQ-type POTRA domain-containing protein [Thermoleophilia bacterium]
MRLPRRPRLDDALPSTPRRRLRLPSRNVVVLLLIAALAASLGAVALVRKSSVFAIRAVHVEGASPELEQAVRRALAPVKGTSLVDLDRARVEQLALRVPAVRSAQVDRDFPGTLTVEVTPERPVAVLRRGSEAWLVAETGRVLRTLGADAKSTLPRIWLEPSVPQPRPGRPLASEETVSALRALARLPKRFPVRVLSARGSAEDLTIVLGGGSNTELRLGPAEALRLKLEVAARVLATIDPNERRRLAYLDVSVPERPGAMSKSQLVG